MMGRTAFIVAFAILATALGALLLFGRNGSLLGMDPDDFASFAYLAALATVIASGLIAARGRRFAPRLWHAAAWLAALVALMAAYQAFHG